MAAVPDGATVQTNLDLLAPLAARTDTFWIGTPGNPLTQYVVFDSDDSGYSAPITNVPAFIATLYPNDGYSQSSSGTASTCSAAADRVRARLDPLETTACGTGDHDR